MATAIQFDGVWKRYRGARAYRALRDDLAGAAARLVGRGSRAPRSVIEALHDVNFEIPEGVSTGFIGHNGAGKTTALKLMSRITYPSDGVIRVRGRVGALIEVGTGMHPELTGRENVRLYGRIMGLTGRDIAKRFDQIVDFAGLGGAIDQPVKQYSSGMQLRIGFSVAAHLEPDILLVDEAIAVGDAGFQYKCVERMGELVREGRTLVFVSHELQAIETLCSRVICLRDGQVAADGPTRQVLHDYLLDVQAERLSTDTQPAHQADGVLRLTRVVLLGPNDEETNEFESGSPLTTRLYYEASEPVRRPSFHVGIGDGRIGVFALASMLVDGKVPEVIVGQGYVDCTFKSLPLHPRSYEVWGSVRGEAGIGDLVEWQRLKMFRVASEPSREGSAAVSFSLDNAPVVLDYEWSIN